MKETILQLPDKIREVYDRLQSHFIKTRLVRDENFSLWLKCEHEQHTGSFKWRGAITKLSQYPKGTKIVTASTGNHGLAVATASALFHLQSIVFVPLSASPVKVNKIQKTGAEIIRVDGDSLAAELAGKNYAKQNNIDWVSPYNDPEVITGQGTIGFELLEDLSNIDQVYVTVGGGGLVSGIASYLKYHDPGIEIIGCQPLNSPEMYLSVQAGHVVQAADAKDTLSDGSAGPLEEDSVTFPIAVEVIDRFILITEQEIEQAIKYLYDIHGLIVEGAAGVAMAAAMKDKRDQSLNAVVILCGGNIDPLIHGSICKNPILQ